jgi:arylsulfatase A-like enzyme
MKESVPLTKQVKIALFWGLVVGILVGSAFAFYTAWYANWYIQKGLSKVVLELFSSRILVATIVSLIIFLTIGPGVSLINGTVSEIRHRGLARLSLILGGIVFFSAGYYINRSEWFPPVASAAGIAGNLAFTIICLGLVIGVYKLLLKMKMNLPAGKNLVARFYSATALYLLIALFLGFNLYANLKLSRLKPEGSNLLIITIDTLRADRLGCYGYSRDTSPTIDRLAEEGTMFTNVYGQRGLTWPSLTSIMTALYPKTHGVLNNQQPLDGKYITLAEILKNLGYRTGAFLANFYYAPNRGFDIKKGGEIGELDKTVTRDAVEWLDGIDPENDKFFMWVHYKNPHDPYEPPQPFRSYFDSTYTGPFNGSRPVLDSIYVNKINLSERDIFHLNALYDAEIRSTDSYIARLLDRLEQKGLANNTLIVFSSDHGEELYERNHYFFHSCSMYDNVLRLPLIMKFPKVIAAGKVIKNQIESIDITPTILQFLKVPLRSEFEGRSVLNLLFEQNGSDSWFPAFAERASAIFSIRTPQWKYIYNPDNYHTYCSRSDDDEGSGYLIAAEELYDIQTDPHERNNVVAQYPDVARDLRGQIIEWLSTNKVQHKQFELTKEAEERLRALGYIK